MSILVAALLLQSAPVATALEPVPSEIGNALQAWHRCLGRAGALRDRGREPLEKIYGASLEQCRHRERTLREKMVKHWGEEEAAAALPELRDAARASVLQLLREARETSL